MTDLQRLIEKYRKEIAQLEARAQEVKHKHDILVEAPRLLEEEGLTPHGMSGLDWFALCTGLIGLVADFVVIASLPRLHDSYHTAPTVIWVVTPALIMYTTIVLSFYVRRIALVRHLEANATLSGQAFYKINKGGVVAAHAVGTPLLLLYEASLMLSFANRLDARTLSLVIFLAILFGIPLSMAVVGIFSRIAGAMYAAFDPRYTVTETR